MKRINYILLFVLFVATTSCVDDFVEDRELSYVQTTENFFNDESEFYQGLVSAYDILQSTYINVLMGEIASDNTLCGGENATDVPGFQQVDDMTQTPINDQLQDLWSWMYAGVNRCSYVLEFTDNGVEFDNKAQMLAEVRFLRAYYYFELVKWFGPVPIKETRFIDGDQLTIPRSPVSEVYAFIESDLTQAIPNLAEDAPQIGRVTKGAAQTLLGKVYLYQDKFSEAATILEEVINSGKYELVGYDEIFEMAGENGPGSVFEVQYSDAEGGSFECLQCSSGNVAVGFNGIRNYSGPRYDSGYSFNVPTQTTYNAYDANDIRRDVSILNIEAWAAANSDVLYGTGYEHTGFFNNKYLPLQGDQNMPDQNLTNPNNYRAIRYADVLLMAAEALNRGGISDVRARDYLNMVRARAFGDNNHAIETSGSNLTNDIWKERRLEFVGEGLRFFDLVRTGQAGNAIPGFTVGKNEVFPVPYEEIALSQGNWLQNPNY